MPPNNQTPDQLPAASAAGNPVAVGSGNKTPATASVKVKNPNSTQNTLKFSEIRDNMIIMADGSFRAIVVCKSINFDLMSSAEREGIEYSYQNFLNALNYPIQIVVRSQRIDIGPYIDRLLEIRKNQDNMLLNVLMDDYLGYISDLAQEANIMDKSFFIAIPYYSQGDANTLMSQGKGFFGKLFTGQKNAITKIDTVSYDKAKTEIKNRVDGVMAGLFQLGIQSMQLSTREIGEMYYNFYNPDTAVNESLSNFENVTSVYTKKGPTETPTPQSEVTS